MFRRREKERSKKKKDRRRDPRGEKTSLKKKTQAEGKEVSPFRHTEGVQARGRKKKGPFL